MSEDATFPLPKGNPEQFELYAKTMLDYEYDNAMDAARKLAAEHAGMAKAWNSPAGAAAAEEVRQVGLLAKEQGEKYKVAADLLKKYGVALDHAQKEVRKIQQEAAEVRVAARKQAFEAFHEQETRRSFMLQDFYDGYLETGLAPLRTRYNQVILEIRETAETYGNQLVGLVPPGWDQKESQAYGSVQDAFADRLPRVAAQRSAADLAGEVKMWNDAHGTVPTHVLEALEKNMDDNPYFAAEFIKAYWPADLKLMLNAPGPWPGDVARRIVTEASGERSPIKPPDYTLTDILGLERDAPLPTATPTR